MSAARAIVATNSGGMLDMLGDNEAGLLVPPGQPAALAAAICRLLGDAELRANLASHARERVLRDYSAARIGPLHEAVFAEAIRKQRG